MNLKQGAAYLSVSYWTVRDYVLAGLIPTVLLPPLRPRVGSPKKAQLRRVLIDREDLDRLIERWKSGARDSSTFAPQTGAVNTQGFREAVPAVCPPGGRR